jgi:hypothetical protein
MKQITEEDLHQYYKNICSTRKVSFEEFKENYYKNQRKWPTLEGRLNQPRVTRKEALLQMYESHKQGWVGMSESALKEVERYLEEDENLQKVRKKVQNAVDKSPKCVSFDEALKQVNRKYDSKNS